MCEVHFCRARRSVLSQMIYARRGEGGREKPGRGEVVAGGEGEGGARGGGRSEEKGGRGKSAIDDEMAAFYSEVNAVEKQSGKSVSYP